MRKRILATFLIVVLSGLAASASAIPLGEYKMTCIGGGTYGVATKFYFGWFVPDVDVLPIDSSILFAHAGMSDIGETFSVTEQTADDFHIFAQGLTDGIDYSYAVFRSATSSTSGGGTGAWESRFTKFVECEGPDFHGYTVSEISMTINDVLIVSPGSNPNGDGQWTDIDYDLTFTVYGEPVPEPASILLLGLPAISLLRRWRNSN